MFDVLLADYPNYSAREVRKLARFIRYLSGLNSKEARGISDELMALTLLKAKIEAQMNDDSALPPLSYAQAKQVAQKIMAPVIVPSIVSADMANRLYGLGKWQYVDVERGSDFEIQRISVTPHSKAIAAIQRIEAAANTDVNLTMTPNLKQAFESARGMVNGTCFSTDRMITKESGVDTHG